MAKKKVAHKYLLQQYLRVDDFLGRDDGVRDDIPEIVVSFCTVIEKLLKLKLYKKNPLLVFDSSKLKDDDVLCIISKRREKEVDTVKIQQLLSRYKIIFPRSFSDEEISALRDIYETRNFFIHGYKPDEEATFDVEDITKKMGTIWEKASKLAVQIFGKESIKNGKPKKKYSESELEAVLMKEVIEKIKLDRGYGQYPFIGTESTRTVGGTGIGIGGSAVLTGYPGGEVCPRCGNHSFSFEPFSYTGRAFSPTAAYSAVTIGDAYLGKFSDLYRCSICNLELTKKEYEIAKEIKGSE